jgi:hypothetical protein
MKHKRKACNGTAFSELRIWFTGDGVMREGPLSTGFTFELVKLGAATDYKMIMIAPPA